MQFSTQSCLAADRSAARFLLSTNCSIQTRIFNQQSARAAACVRGLLFLSPRATKHNKIRVFVNSFTGEGLPALHQAIGTRISGRDSHPTCLVFVFSSSTRHRRVVSISQYNRFSLPCKPPDHNNLQGYAEADAQSSQPGPTVNPPHCTPEIKRPPCRRI